MPAISQDRLEEIESLVVEWLDETDVPGASVVVFDAETEQYAEGFGARDLESNAPATPETLYGMGSITKPVTSLAIMQLAEAGHLSIDDSVNAYIEQYADAPGDPITIGELLSHTSGMPAANPGLLDQAFEGFPAGVADESDRERFVRASTAFRATDAERFHYYNTGYDMLGAVVEAVDGRTYAEYVSEEIFQPLGMERSTFHAEPFEADDDTMTGYRPGSDDEPPEPEPFPFEAFIHPAGGLISSARELSRFMRAMMTDGSFDGNRVCSAEAVERLQRARAERNSFLDGTDEQYGYGWMRHPLIDDEAIGHGGSILISTAYAAFLDAGELGVVVACNSTADPHPIDVGQAILAIATGHDRTVVPAYGIKEKFEAVTGEYAAFRESVTATVDEANGQLSLTLSSAFGDEEVLGFPNTLDPDDHTFYAVSSNGTRDPIEFDLSGEHDDLYIGRNHLRRTG